MLSNGEPTECRAPVSSPAKQAKTFTTFWKSFWTFWPYFTLTTLIPFFFAFEYSVHICCLLLSVVQRNHFGLAPDLLAIVRCSPPLGLRHPPFYQHRLSQNRQNRGSRVRLPSSWAYVQEPGRRLRELWLGAGEGLRHGHPLRPGT